MKKINKNRRSVTVKMVKRPINSLPSPVFSFDWATKKDFVCYDSQKDEVKKISNSIDEFEKFLVSLNGKKAIMLFEMGGADTLKIMAFRAGHSVLCVPGKKIKEYREAKGIEKSDEADAKLIYEYYQANNGKSAENIVKKTSRMALPLPDEPNGGSARNKVNQKSIIALPSPFYLFSELDAKTAELKILFRDHENLKKDMVREKLKKIAFVKKFQLANVADDRIKKILFHKDTSIIAKEKEFEHLKKILEKKVKGFDMWNNYLKNIKAVGPVIAAGLIGETGGKQFDSKESIKHYSGMITKKGNDNFNRNLKAVLYQFAEGVIKHRTPYWRELYDNIKIYYQKKHQNWRKSKVNAYAKKFIETKFIIEFWKVSNNGRSAIDPVVKKINNLLPSPILSL